MTAAKDESFVEAFEKMDVDGSNGLSYDEFGDARPPRGRGEYYRKMHTNMMKMQAKAAGEAP